MTAELPISIVWSKTLFPEGSLGRTVFPDDLEGRERSSSILSNSARVYIVGINRWAYFEKAGITTVKDLLKIDETSLASLLREPQSSNLAITKQVLSENLDEVIIGPEDRLMLAIFGRAPGDVLIPPSLEPVRKERIMDVLASIPDQESQMIQLHYGITTFTPKSLLEISKEHNITRLRARHITTQALRKLRHPSKRNQLREFLPSN